MNFIGKIISFMETYQLQLGRIEFQIIHFYSTYSCFNEACCITTISITTRFRSNSLREIDKSIPLIKRSDNVRMKTTLWKRQNYSP